MKITTASKPTCKTCWPPKEAAKGWGCAFPYGALKKRPLPPGKIIKQETERYPAVKGLSPVVFSPEVCDIWKVEKQAAKENQAIQSSIPTLLISGEYDNETPISWAEQLSGNLENSFHLIFKGWKHTPTFNWGNLCAMEMAQAFFNDPNQKPKAKCFEQIKTPKFTIPKTD